MSKPEQQLLVIGWREWLVLPELGIKAIKAKIDTGARTSALHAFYIERFRSHSIEKVRFGIHPLQKKTDPALHCETVLLDQRSVTDSGGHTEQRYVIETPVIAGDMTYPIQITLTNRDTMRFRMLMGRTALEDRFLVDVAQSYLFGKRSQIKERTIHTSG
jgi:hypothetical protein